LVHPAGHFGLTAVITLWAEPLTQTIEVFLPGVVLIFPEAEGLGLGDKVCGIVCVEVDLDWTSIDELFRDDFDSPHWLMLTKSAVQNSPPIALAVCLRIGAFTLKVRVPERLHSKVT
jgi:hypothetical protein